MQFQQRKIFSTYFFGSAFAIIFWQRCFTHTTYQRLMHRSIALWILIFSTQALIAQDQLSQNNVERLYSRGTELVAHSNYGAARAVFSDFLRLASPVDTRREEAEYYVAFSALSLGHNDGEKLIDDKARKQYQKKIIELQSEIREAEQRSDSVALEKLQVEYDRLIDHLSKALGLKGKARQAGSTVEKARSAVTWRIRKAIARIEQCLPNLGAHLSNAI